MPYTQGKPLCPQEKRLLVSVKHYFDWNVATVNRGMGNYRRDPDSVSKNDLTFQFITKKIENYQFICEGL